MDVVGSCERDGEAEGGEIGLDVGVRMGLPVGGWLMIIAGRSCTPGSSRTVSDV